jgi:hypothetical protein
MGLLYFLVGIGRIFFENVIVDNGCLFGVSSLSWIAFYV